MLETIDLKRRLSKEEYRLMLPGLRNRLYDLQKTCRDNSVPVVILFEGWDAAGKGTSINALTRRLDPRGFRLYAIQGPRTYEIHMPWLWRFWIKLPNYGEIAIFDRSWYGRVGVERVEKLAPESKWRKGFRDIVDFERTLSDDGHLMIKFFLHISKKEQAKRFKKIEADPIEYWRVQTEDWVHHKKYDKYLIAYEEMFERTESEWGPWEIIEATDRRWAQIRVFESIITRFEQKLKERGVDLPDVGKKKAARRSRQKGGPNA